MVRSELGELADGLENEEPDLALRTSAVPLVPRPEAQCLVPVALLFLGGRNPSGDGTPHATHRERRGGCASRLSDQPGADLRPQFDAITTARSPSATNSRAAVLDSPVLRPVVVR